MRSPSLTLVFVCLASLSVTGTRLLAQATPTLHVDAASNLHPINPNIYGIVASGLDPNFAKEIQVPNVRWGGDSTTRYNWQVDSSNAGFDWYFMGGNGQNAPVPSASADNMISTYKAAGARSLITIPIIPYVNKTSAWNCSFPVSVYGAQQSTNPYVHPSGDNCGNSLSAAGTQLTDRNIYSNHVDNSPALQTGWLQHLTGTFGTAANGGVPFYQLDNEPAGWGNTHRDVQPGGAPYSTIVSLGQQYAAAIKAVDATAQVLGPSDFTLGGWIGNPGQQNNLFAGQYYLQQMAAYDTAHHQRLIDDFDEHYYFQFSDPASQLASTRTLWDPTYNGGTWVEQYEFNGPMQLIPRFKQWIMQYYPGTKLAFSEYSIDSGNKKIIDAIAEADVLGIFGREGVDFANMWIPPAPTEPIAYAFRLYRNFDGQGGRFGDTGIQATSTDQTQLAIYGAQRATDGALTLVVLNKTPGAVRTTLSIANYDAGAAASVYQYSGADLTQVASVGATPVTANSILYSFPSYSATVFVVAGSVPAAQPVPNGSYTLTNQVSGLVLDDPHASTASGTQMIQWAANGGSNQRWTLQYSGGYYTIQNSSSLLFLTDPGLSGLDPLQQQTAQAGDTQRWSISSSGTSWTLHNKATGRVVDDAYGSTSQGNSMITWPANGGPNQLWSIR